MMKIKLLHTYKLTSLDSVGGIENFIEDLVLRGINLNKYEVRVVATSNFETKVIQQKGVTFYLYKSLFTILSVPFSPGYILNFKKHFAWADLIHAHFPWPFFDLLLLTITRKKPIIITYHSDVIKQKFLNIFYHFLIYFTFAKTYKIVATSNNYLKSSKLLQKNEVKKKCCVINLSIQIPPSSELSFKSQNLLKKFALESNNYVLFVGTFRYYKNIKLLLDAAPYINSKIVLIGDGPLRSYYEKYCQDCNITNVNFLGNLSNYHKNNLISHCALLVLPSHLRSEAFGLVLLEASSLCRPMVTQEIGTGTSFVNLDNKTGIVIKSNNFIKLFLAINKILSNKLLARKMGQNALLRFNKLFRYPLMVQKYERLYNAALRSFH